MGEQNFNENELVVVPCFDRGWPAISRELKGVRESIVLSSGVGDWDRGLLFSWKNDSRITKVFIIKTSKIVASTIRLIN